MEGKKEWREGGRERIHLQLNQSLNVQLRTVTVSKDSASLWWAVCLISFKDDIDCFNESNCNWHHE